MIPDDDSNQYDRSIPVEIQAMIDDTCDTRTTRSKIMLAVYELERCLNLPGPVEIYNLGGSPAFIAAFASLRGLRAGTAAVHPSDYCRLFFKSGDEWVEV
jgi:hypothetical protein